MVFRRKILEITAPNKNGDLKGWTPLLLFVSYATTIGTAIPVGYCLGALNTPAEFIKTWCVETLLLKYDWNVSPSQNNVLWASIVSIFLVGGICGSFVGAWCCDRFGRKGCLLISALLLIISGLLLLFCRMASSVEMLLIGRFIAGVASALIYTAHPMYLMEMAPSELRDTVGVFTAVGVTAGIVVGQIFSLHQILGTESLWQYAISFYGLIVVVCFLPAYWFPESPRWLCVIKKNVNATRFELERLRRNKNKENISKEIANMESSINENTRKSTFKSVITNPELLLPLVLVCSLQISQQLSGINAIFYYSITIFTKAGFSNENAGWMNLGAGCLNLLISLMGPVLMANFNRRPLMMISSAGCAIAHVGISFGLFYIDAGEWLAISCIVFIAIFIILFQLGLGPIPYFIGSELFEVSPRPVAMSLGSLFSWTGNFLIGMCFPLFESVVGGFAFMPCCAVCVFSLLLTWKYLPESRGRDAVELRALMSDGFKSKVK